jgi:AlkA N-terminal domain
MARASGTPPPTDGSWLTLPLGCREPFDAAALLAFLAARAIPGVERVAGDRYARTVRTTAGPGLVELTLPGGAQPPNGRRHVLLRARLPGRLAARVGTGVDGPTGWPSLLFPAPGDLAEADLSGLGVTGARQATLRALAEAVASGRLALDRGAGPEETAARLAELRGIGPWTVSYILMRAVGDRDAFPSTDLGLRRALGALGCPVSRAERWRPWRAYAAVHLWTWARGNASPGGG